MFDQPTIAFLFLHFIGVYSATFTLVNRCNYTVWPATLSGAGTAQLPATATGFTLLPGNTTAITVPPSWSGRVWARTLCSTGPAGNFSCATGDCGTGTVQCSGSGAAPPATLAEFTLNGSGGLDFYDVSLVDGYNLPLLIRPAGGSGLGNCTAAGCVVDLNGSCPAQLRVVSKSVVVGEGEEGVACKSACDAFGAPQYCCSGAYSTPDMCKPSSYSEYFKNACPSAYSYAYDDASSTFTCQGADYVITFCPTATATDKSSGPQLPEASPISPEDYYLNSTAQLFPLSTTTIIGLIMMTIWASSLPL